MFNNSNTQVLNVFYFAYWFEIGNSSPHPNETKLVLINAFPL